MRKKEEKGKEKKKEGEDKMNKSQSEHRFVNGIFFGDGIDR